MDFGFSPEQEELRTTVRQFFAKHAAGLTERAVGDLDRPLWTKLTQELGLTALAIDESYGGFGVTLVEVAIVIEEAGRVLLALPYLSTVATAAALSASVGNDILAGIAGGATLATLAIAEPGSDWDLDRLATTARADGTGYRIDGVKEHVTDGDVADVVVVVAACDGEPALFAVAAADVCRERLTTLDQTRPVARLTLEGTPAMRVSPPGDGGATARHALDILHTLLAVEAIGVASASLDLTMSYLLAREQFGVPLATFQALRHRVADLVVTLEAATSTAWYAVRTATAGSRSTGWEAVSSSADRSGLVGSELDSELAVVAPMAKLVAAEAAYMITAEAVQLHGGIGFTWEHHAHRYLKRATVGRLSYGDPVTLRRLIGARAGL
jgi:alkylation response protein AidB-like acyl-CoA dehydrogenase